MKIHEAFFLLLETAQFICAGADISLNITSTAADTNRTAAIHEISRGHYASMACAEFRKNVPNVSGWLFSDCVLVWNGWATTLEEQQLKYFTYPKTLREMTGKLRRRSNECLVDSVIYPDGAGSSAVRYLATWIFAEEIGCEWVLAHAPPSDAVDDIHKSIYCHKTVPFGQLHALQNKVQPHEQLVRCTPVNWLQFFNFDRHAISDVRNGTTKTINAGIDGNSDDLVQEIEDFNLQPHDHRRWDYLLFHLGKSTANRFFQLVSSWDRFKRDITRDVLKRFRDSFHEFSVSRFDHVPDCMYSSSQELDFAIHVRLGDRTRYLNGFEKGYLEYLDKFIGTVTMAITRRGFDTPTFHVFSETSLPCPSKEKRTFTEFPDWPVETYQIAPCLTALTPKDCPEKDAGLSVCSPERSGIFRIAGKPLYLHVGTNVKNDLTCMTQADGILMGCSTFGQISGVLNRGLKFFSFECSGYKTPNHYKMMPPLAVAENGDLWVPMSGSWHDPEILSTAIFEAALDVYLKSKGA